MSSFLRSTCVWLACTLALSCGLLGFDSKLYVSWVESGQDSYAVRIAAGSGSTPPLSWKYVDAGGITGLPDSPSLCVLDGKLVLYSAGDSTQVRVFNGDEEAPDWTPFEGDTGFCGATGK